jgi:CheY-like chemotaxis protein
MLVKMALTGASSGISVDVTSLPNAVVGVKAAAADVPDVILLDIEMVGFNGFDALDHLKKDPKTSKIPILMLSSLARMADVEKALANGAAGYITKPFDVARLCGKLRKLLEANKQP